MMVSDPALAFDFKLIGQKVQYNQHKHDSVDGFIKQGEECFVILPPVYKVVSLQNNNQSVPNQNTVQKINQNNSNLKSDEPQTNQNSHSFPSIFGSIPINLE